jgi:hypothetical protein
MTTNPGKHPSLAKPVIIPFDGITFLEKIRNQLRCLNSAMKTGRLIVRHPEKQMNKCSYRKNTICTSSKLGLPLKVKKHSIQDS